MTAWTKQFFTLNNGIKMPALGLGTWQSGPDEVRKAVKAALDIGYRHIDTAQAYGNEAEVGQGIVDSGVPRSEIFLTTKVDNNQHKRVAACVDESLQRLQTDYVDLLLMHWPCSLDINDGSKVYSDWTFVDTWKEMTKVVESGKAKAIGVSNFGIKNLEKLLAAGGVVPAVNQIELHPNSPSDKLIAFNTSKGIHTTAYSLLGSTNSPLVHDKTLLELAEKKGKTLQQVLIVWALKRGTSAIPKSVTPSRIEANFQIDGIELSDEEMKIISSRPERFKVCDEWLPEPIFNPRDEYDGDFGFENKWEKK